MISSLFATDGQRERLLTRASNHRSQLEDLRKAYLSEMRRCESAGEQQLPEYVRLQCHNVALAIERAEIQLGQLEARIEEAEAVEAAREAQIELEALVTDDGEEPDGREPGDIDPMREGDR